MWALVLSALGLEIGWRVYLHQVAPVERLGKFARLDDMPERALRLRPHPYLVHALNPGFAGDDGLARHNALGLRGPEVAREKRPGVFRIVCIGGSATYGTRIASDAETYPALLERVLRDAYARPEVEVLNAGVPGYTSWETSIDLALRVLDLAPDLVVYRGDVHDVEARLVPSESYRADNTGYRAVWPRDEPWWDRSLVVRWFGVQSGLSPRNALDATVIEHDEDRELEALLVANPPVHYRRNVEAIAVLAQSGGAEIVLAGAASCASKEDPERSAVRQRARAEHDAVLAEVARTRGAAWLDLRAAMPADPALWENGSEVNALGARREAELCAQFVVTMMPAR